MSSRDTQIWLRLASATAVLIVIAIIVLIVSGG
jgi:hypothetical protein